MTPPVAPPGWIHTVAGRWRVDPDDLDAWLESGAPTSTVPAYAAGRARSSTSLGLGGVDAIAGVRLEGRTP